MGKGTTTGSARSIWFLSTRCCLAVFIFVFAFFNGKPGGRPSERTGQSNKRTDGKMGALRVNPRNPRYFTDGSGRAIYLTGSHTWNNFQDIGEEGETPFDYDEYLNFLERYNHNFFRLWAWEHSGWAPISNKKIIFQPLYYLRTGPGKALDGGDKFSLSECDQRYLDRLRVRVERANRRGIYVAVMLFQGFSIETKGYYMNTWYDRLIHKFAEKLGVNMEAFQGNSPWLGHPFNARNNAEEIDGDPLGTGTGRDLHTLRLPHITRIQEAYVKKIIDTVGDLDNVLWEISNESHSDSTEWQYHLIDFIHRYEELKGKKHPVWMTAQWPGGMNEPLFTSPAEVVSPRPQGGYKDDPPPADGRKIVISDTDHLWGVGGDYKWVWKSFLSGLHLIFMDPYDGRLAGAFPSHYPDPASEQWELVRKNMGYTRSLSQRTNLEEMLPRPDLASSGHCLAEAGKDYLVYVPGGEDVTVNLTGAVGLFDVEWLDPLTGVYRKGEFVEGGSLRSFASPFSEDAVLHAFSR